MVISIKTPCDDCPHRPEPIITTYTYDYRERKEKEDIEDIARRLYELIKSRGMGV